MSAIERRLAGQFDQPEHTLCRQLLEPFFSPASMQRFEPTCRSIAAGEPMSLIWIAANRGGRAFDDHDRVQLDRDSSANLVFGNGIHDCVGATMARLELQVALEELLSRTARIELSAAHTPERLTVPSNGVSTLYLRLTPTD